MRKLRPQLTFSFLQTLVLLINIRLCSFEQTADSDSKAKVHLVRLFISVLLHIFFFVVVGASLENTDFEITRYVSSRMYVKLGSLFHFGQCVYVCHLTSPLTRLYSCSLKQWHTQSHVEWISSTALIFMNFLDLL